MDGDNYIIINRIQFQHTVINFLAKQTFNVPFVNVNMTKLIIKLNFIINNYNNYIHNLIC